MYVRVQELHLGGALLSQLRRTPQLPPPPYPPQPACPRRPPSPASPPPRHGCARHSRGRVGGTRPAPHAIRFGASADRTDQGLKAWLSETLGWQLTIRKHWWTGLRGVWGSPDQP